MLKLFKISGVVFALILAALVIFIVTFDANRYKDEISEAVEDATGRKLEIDGALNLKLFNFPTIYIESVKFANAEWASTPDMASMQSLELDIALKPLLKGVIQVNKLTLIEPVISLETNQQGIGNWEFDNADDDAEKPEHKSKPSQFGLSLDNIKIENAKFSYVDGVSEQSQKLHVSSLSLTKAGNDALDVDLKATYQDVPVTLSATTGQPDLWLNNQTVPLQLTLVANDNAKLNIDGNIVEPITGQSIQATIKTEIESLADLSKLAGTELPALPAISLTGELQRQHQDVAVKQLAIQLGDSDLSGNLSANLAGKRPTIHADLKSDLLDLIPLIPASTDEQAEIAPTTTETVADSTAEQVQAGDSSSSTQALPLAALKAFNADIKLNLAQIHAPSISLTDVTTEVALKDGLLTIKPLALSAVQGQLSGELTVDARQPAASIQTTLNIEHMMLSELPELAQYVANAQTDMQLTLATTGETLEQLINTAQGQLIMNAGPTELKGAQWASNANLASVQQLQLDVSFEQSTQTVRLNQLKLTQPVVTAETNDQGVGNWVLSETASPETDEKAETTTDSPAYQIVLNNIQIANADIRYADGVSKQTHHLLVDTFSLTEKDETALTIDTALQYQDTPITLTGTSGKLMALLNDANFPVDLTSVVNNDAKLHLQGHIDAPLSKQNVALTVNGEIQKLASLSKITNSELPELQPMSLSAQLNLTGDNIAVQGLSFRHGKSDLSGAVTVNLSDKQPLVQAKLTSKLLDLTELPKTEQPEKPEKTDKDAKVFSSEPLPIDLLNKLKGEVTLQADRIKTEETEIKKVNLVAKAHDGKITLKPLDAIIAEGKLAGELQLSSAKDAVVLNTDITVKGLQPRQISSLRQQIEEGAATDVLVKLKGSGNSISSIMAGANGVITIQSAPAKLSVEGGFLTADFLTSLIPSGESDNKLQLECAVINYKIEEGVATAEKGIAIVTDKINIIGSSEINLKTEALDINLKPHVREGLGISVANLADLVSIGGTLANPSTGADVLSTLSTGLEVQSAIATAGLSILAKGLFDKITADSDPCATALGIEPKTKPENETQVPGQPANETTSP